MLPNPPDPLEILDAGQESRAALFAPSPVYVTGEESLRVTAVSNTASVTLTINGRSLRPNSTPSPLNETLKPTNNRVVTSAIYGLAEGWLLGLTARATAGSPAAGSTWVLFELVRGSGNGAQVTQTLGYGFVTANSPYAWPVSANTSPLAGPGHLRAIAGATPAAGAEISETVPTGARWQLQAFRYQNVTAVAVANRQSTLQVDDGTTNLFYAGGESLQAASATYLYSYAQGFAPLTGTPTNAISRGLPSPCFLQAGARIRTQTIAIQPADQYSAVNYLVREWFPLE